MAIVLLRELHREIELLGGGGSGGGGAYRVTVMD